MWALAAAFGSWSRRLVYFDNRPPLKQVELNTIADSAAFILYRIFSILRMIDFSSTGRLYRRVPKLGPAGIAGVLLAEFLAGITGVAINAGVLPVAGVEFRAGIAGVEFRAGIAGVEF